jgi:hypothetical protein
VAHRIRSPGSTTAIERDPLSDLRDSSVSLLVAHLVKKLHKVVFASHTTTPCAAAALTAAPPAAATATAVAATATGAASFTAAATVAAALCRGSGWIFVSNIFLRRFPKKM